MVRTIKNDLKWRTSFIARQNDKERTASIFLIITFACNRVKIYTQCRCDSSEWDKKKMRVVNGKGKNKINVKLNDYESLVMELFSGYDSYPTVEKIREDIKARIITPEKPQSIYEIFEEYIDINARLKSWSVGTIKRARVLKNHLFTFNPNTMSFS